MFFVERRGNPEYRFMDCRARYTRINSEYQPKFFATKSQLTSFQKPSM